MDKTKQFIILIFFIFLLFLALSVLNLTNQPVSAAFNGNCSGYTYGDKVGFISFNTTASYGVEVTDSILNGYAWVEKVGYIRMHGETGVCIQPGGGCVGGYTYSVANDGTGKLSGYAWSEKGGWIRFAATGSDYSNTLASNYGVYIDENSNFNGFAWGEKTGWIHFKYSNGYSYGVTTDWSANNAPTNGAGSITNMENTDNIYAQRKWYTGGSICSDADGFADIDYCEFRLKQGAVTRAIFRYDEDTDTFSVESGSTEWDLDASGSGANESGNDITITWKFKPQWDAVEEDDLEIELYVIDSASASDVDTAQTNYVDVVTDLVTTFSIDDDRGNISQPIILSGAVTYSGCSLYPPDAEFTSVSVYDSANNNEGTDSTIVNGAWSVTFNAPATVGTDTYNLYINMADADYTDGEEVTPTDTFITDQIEIVSVAFNDSRIDISGSAEVRYVFRYDYDEAAFTGADGSIVGLTWDAGGSWWDKAITGSATVGTENYDETDISFTDLTYGLTAIKDDAGADIITDRIKILTLSAVDSTIFVRSQGVWYATAELEYDNHSLGSGDSVTLSSYSFSWNVSGNRFEAADTKNTPQTVTINAFDSGLEATYGITAGTINGLSQFVKWQAVPVTGGGLPPIAYMPPSPPSSTKDNPQGGFNFLINKGVETINIRKITLTLFAGSDTKRMAISEDPNFTYAVQELYQSSKEWTLSEGDGKKTIYVKFFSHWGKPSKVISTSVILETIPRKLIFEKPITEMTAEELKIKIVEIKDIIAGLQTQFEQLLEKEVVPEIPDIHKFTKYLWYGQKDEEVRYLQIFLKAQGPDIYPEGLVTGCFKTLTEAAVKKFQIKYGIVSSEDDDGAGYIGPKTRAKINEILGY